MSFAIFDSLFSILSEEIDVPVSKLKKAWDISLLKFFKTDPTVLSKVAPKLQQSKKPVISIEEHQVFEDQTKEETVVVSKEHTKKLMKSEETLLVPKEKTKKISPTSEYKQISTVKEPIKLPNCDEPSCTIKVKLARPIDGKNYCSKHYQKHSKALSKKESPFKINKQQSVKEVEKSVTDDYEEELDSETESHIEEEIEESRLESEQEDSESTETLHDLKERFDKYFKQPVTAQNFTKVGTMDQYLVFFRDNWDDFQKIYEELINIEDLETLIQKKKVQKADLFTLFEKISPKLVSV
jgi:hypothetical protein